MTFTQPGDIGNHMAVLSKYFSGSCVPQGSEDFSVGNSVVTPISEKTEKVGWQYPSYFPRILKKVRINAFDTPSLQVLETANKEKLFDW